MSKSKSPSEFTFESLQDSESIVTYLEAVAKGFKNSHLLFCSGKQELLLYPQGLLRFAVRAKRKDGQVKVGLEVSWRESGTQQPPEQKLVISAGEDEPREED